MYLVFFLLLFIGVIIALIAYFYRPSYSGGAEEDVVLHEHFRSMFESDVIGKKDQPVIMCVDELPLKVTWEDLESSGAFHMVRFGAHFGQRKLFLSEIMFLSMVSEPGLVVYAGSNPGQKMWLIADMFPQHKYLMVDPSEAEIFIDYRNDRQVSHYHEDNGDIEYLYVGMPDENKDPVMAARYMDIPKTVTYKGARIPFEGAPHEHPDVLLFNKRISIYQDYMTEQLAAKIRRDWGGIIYFISDIRSNTEELKHESQKLMHLPGDLDIVINISQQNAWTRILKPAKFMHKTRPVYAENAEQIIESKVSPALTPYLEEQIPYLRNGCLGIMPGRLYLQAWPGPSSAELRLIGDSYDELQSMPCNDMFDRCFYYNNFDRGYIHHENPYSSADTGMCNCADCALEIKIWQMCGVDNIPAHVQRLTQITGRPLRHKKVIRPYSSFEQILELVRKTPRKIYDNDNKGGRITKLI